MAFLVYLGFSAAFRAADIIPFRFYCYFFKSAMLFAYKLINRHCILPGENILSETLPLILYSANSPDCFSFFWEFALFELS